MQQQAWHYGPDRFELMTRTCDTWKQKRDDMQMTAVLLADVAIGDSSRWLLDHFRREYQVAKTLERNAYARYEDIVERGKQ